MPLDVSVPSHCALMQPAADRMAGALAGCSVSDAAIPVVQNVSATAVTDADLIRENLYWQLISPVRWTDSVRYMAEQGVTAMAESGPGKGSVGPGASYRPGSWLFPYGNTGSDGISSGKLPLRAGSRTTTGDEDASGAGGTGYGCQPWHRQGHTRRFRPRGSHGDRNGHVGIGASGISHALGKEGWNGDGIVMNVGDPESVSAGISQVTQALWGAFRVGEQCGHYP